jgi:hypothetical protein
MIPLYLLSLHGFDYAQIWPKSSSYIPAYCSSNKQAFIPLVVRNF